MADTSKLLDYEVQALVSFFTYTMDQNQRQMLTRSFPVIYMKLYPSVKLSVSSPATRAADEEEG